MISKQLLGLDYSKATANLIEFWRRLPRPEGSVCPKYADFSSARINGNLPEVFISEWGPDDDLRLVQTGTVLDRLLGRDLTGLSIFEMTDVPAIREEAQAYYIALRDTPCAGSIIRSARGKDGRPLLYQTIQLPLLDPYGKPGYFVGTGAVINKGQEVQGVGFMELENLALVELHFYDIGNGLPLDISKIGGSGDNIYFHGAQP